MKKGWIVLFLMLIILLAVGCKNNSTSFTTLKETKQIDVNQGTAIAEVKITSQLNMPKDFVAKELYEQNNVTLEWNGVSSLCNLGLAIGSNNNAIITFNAHLEDITEVFEVTSANTILTGYLYNANNLLLITKNTKEELVIECYNYYGKKRAEYSLGQAMASDYKVIASDIGEFYLTYKLKKQLHIDTFLITDNSIDLQKENKFRSDIVEIFSDKSTIFLKRTAEQGFYIDILNKQLAPLDIVKINKKADIKAIKYYKSKNESLLKLFLDDSGIIKEYLIPQENNYANLYEHTVLENKTIKKDDRHTKHYIIYDSLYGVFENGYKCDLKIDDVFKDDFSNVDFYKIDLNGYVVANKNFAVSYLSNNKEVKNFMRVKDYFVALNENNEICETYPKYDSEVLNDTFIGEKFEYGFVSVNDSTHKLYYLNKLSKAVYAIDKNRNKELIANIPDNVWESTINEEVAPILYVDNNMVSLIQSFDSQYSIMHYCNLKTKQWSSLTTDNEIYLKDGLGVFCNIGKQSLKFDLKTNSFKRYFLKQHEEYDFMVIDDSLFLNNIVYQENINANTKMQVSPYVTYKNNYVKHRIIDSKSSANQTIAREYKTHKLFDISQKSCNYMFDSSVRKYDLSEQGILFTGYEEEAILYYFDFNSGKISTLYNKGLITDLAIKDNYAYFISLEEQKKLIKINIATGQLKEIKLSDNELVFKVSNNYLAIASQNHKNIKILDTSKFALTDTISGKNYFWHNNQLLYECGGYLVSYNPQTKKMKLIAKIGDSTPFVVHQNQIYYTENGGEVSPVNKTALNKVIALPVVIDNECLLIKADTSYNTSLLVIDSSSRLIEVVSDARIEYKIIKNIIQYRSYNYNSNRWGDWQEYKVNYCKLIKEIVIN